MTRRRPGHAPARDLGGQELGLLGAVRPGPEVDVVGVQGDPRELRVGVGVLDGEPAAGQHAGPAARPRPGPRAAAASASGQLAGASSPVSRSRTSGVVSRSGALRVAEAEAALVADPLLVDLGVVAGEPPHDLAAPVVGAGRAAAPRSARRRSGEETRSKGRERNR